MPKMYATTGEQLVYLVWTLKNDRPTLAVICTSDADLKRYVSDDRKTWASGDGSVFVEKVMCDHLYGARDASIALRLMRQSA